MDSLQLARQARHGAAVEWDSGLVPVLERLTSHQWASKSTPAAAGPANGVGATKRQAVLCQIKAQQQALALLSRNAPVPAELLHAVGPPTSDCDPQVRVPSGS